ncbi:RTA1 like protein-domain-containing protein [Leptodontidium sp. 2 PMI_412]|nr:RTA1 like protein-domain-containing protein [Leptodontidium sp. MPI-SDFR-AT-0119]KAH9212961.1 RTA1 like protein-domain-containing protein [Leptodontidium sp. 2 PMI_412]
MANDESSTGSGYDWKAYRYDPSLVAAIIFIVCFILTTFFHLYQLVRTRTCYFVPLCIGGFFEWIGYIGRALSSQESPNWSLGPYIMQTLLLLIAPALFAASIYMELARVIELVDGESHSMIRRRWLTKLFVAGDVLSFTLQIAGGGIMSSGSLSSVHLGEKIVIVGLFVQIIFFGFFVFIALSFNVRMHKVPTEKAHHYHDAWHKHINTLYVASLLIMVRSVFRVVEYIQGNDGYLLRHEYYLYIFDAVLMLAVMVIFNFIHPSEVKALLKGGKMAKGLKMCSVK